MVEKQIEKQKIDSSLIEDHVAAYEAKKPTIAQFTQKFSGLLTALTSASGIKVQSIESRTKTISSFKEKLARPGKHYVSPIDEITDLSGHRIVVYYQSDVDRISKLLKNEFTVDPANSIDKGDDLKPNEFGYRSVHYIASLKDPRLSLSEWQDFNGLEAEIQVRTVLQHAWAAINHTLIFKTDRDIPSDFRRRLSRLAGLFELADEEFGALRKQSSKLTRAISHQLDQGDMDIELNMISLTKYIEKSTQINQAFESAILIGYDRDDVDDQADSIFIMLHFAVKLGLNSISDMDETLGSIRGVEQSYLAMLFDDDERDESKGWTIDQGFVALLLLVLAFPREITIQMLVRRGWDARIAERVIRNALKAGRQ